MINDVSCGENIEKMSKLYTNDDPIEDVTNELFDLIDTDKIQFESDETWLHHDPKCKKSNLTIAELFSKPIRNKHGIDALFDNWFPNSASSKNYNTQTFTRPKKKFTRPSIERYNEEIYSEDKNCSKLQTATKPLHFDLTQSATTNYLRNMIAIEDIESFENMSLPSLVNSLCSSTITNIDSNIYKSDLSLINDLDMSVSLIDQVPQTYMVDSMTNSINSSEDFLNKISQNDSFTRDLLSEAGFTTIFKTNDYTFQKKDDIEVYHDASDENYNMHSSNTNGTFRKSTRLSSATFRKSDGNPKLIKRTDTFKINDSFEDLPTYNKTFTYDENIANIEVNETYEKINNSINSTQVVENNDNRKSWDCSAGSTDSLDRMSSLSGSSKGSNKMLNIKEVEAITQKQEKSLMATSTPLICSTFKHLSNPMWDRYVSAVVSHHVISDSEVSSGDEYKSVKSSFSKNSLDSNHLKQTRSLASLQDEHNKMKSINTLIDKTKKTGIRGSASNLTRLIPTNCQNKLNAYQAISNTNLNKMSTGLRGSYTSLKPVNTVLPVAPPLIKSNTKQNMASLSAESLNKKEVMGPPYRTTQTPLNLPGSGPSANEMSGDGVFLKPKPSGLPRPTTGIPRPSKIPGPSTSRVQSSKIALHGNGAK